VLFRPSAQHQDRDTCVRFVEMAHEYWLASLLIRNELSSDLSAGNAYHIGGTNWPSNSVNPASSAP
jgi:hypothetical protein